MDIAAIIQDAAPFSFLAVACGATSPVWLASIVSLFVPNRLFRLGTGIPTALAGAFITLMGVSAYLYGSRQTALALRHVDPQHAAMVEQAGHGQAMSALILFASVGLLALVLGSVATVLGARTPRAANK